MPPLPADPGQVDLLRALFNRSKRVPKTAQTLVQIGKSAAGQTDLPAALATLVADGLIEKQQGASLRSVAKYVLTADAAAALAALAPAPKAASSSANSALAALEERLLAAILPRLERIERALAGASRDEAGASSPSSAVVAKAAQPLTEEALLGLVHEVGAKEKSGSLVPIGLVRALAHERSGVDRDAFDARLLALERAFRIDLKVADDPRRPDAGSGIEVPGRGLVFYAVDRMI